MLSISGCILVGLSSHNRRSIQKNLQICPQQTGWKFVALHNITVSSLGTITKKLMTLCTYQVASPPGPRVPLIALHVSPANSSGCTGVIPRPLRTIATVGLFAGVRVVQHCMGGVWQVLAGGFCPAAVVMRLKVVVAMVRMANGVANLAICIVSRFV